jgi:molecular chaperone GrpE
MSERPTPDSVENTPLDGAPTLTPERIEAVLADFRAWLITAAEIPSTDPVSLDEPLDLYTLVAQFTALRHEVNLQTKAVRVQQEQSGDALKQLSTALDALRQAQSAARATEEQVRDEAVRPLLKTLIDVYDALALAEREVRRTQESLARDESFDEEGGSWDDDLEENDSPPDEPTAAVSEAGKAPGVAPVASRSTSKPSFWARLFGLDRVIRAQEERIDQLTQDLATARASQEPSSSPRVPEENPELERLRQTLASVLTGYTMSLQRVERTLWQHGLEPIPAVGAPFDPESMEVLEAVEGSGRPAGEVVSEVRRGYLWRGKLFRYAQVRVARIS